MTPLAVRTFETPHESDLGLRRIANPSGLAISVLPNGCVFAIEHQHERGRTLINQVQGSPLDGGIARLYLRIRAPEPAVAEAVGPRRAGQLRRRRRSLHLGRRDWRRAAQRLAVAAPAAQALAVAGRGREHRHAEAVSCDAILVQDVGLGDRGFLMNNEAYASQYIDHHVARHPRCGPVVMSRQNLAQSSGHPWVAHGCFEGAAGFATDAMQLLGPAVSGLGRDRPRARSAERATPARGRLPDDPVPSSSLCSRAAKRHGRSSVCSSLTMPRRRATADLSKIDQAQQTLDDFVAGPAARCEHVRSLLQDAAPVAAQSLDDATVAERYPERAHEEHADGRLMSFFTPDGLHNRHVVLRAKEQMVPRRHGTLLRTGQGMLPDEATLCATCWMHGVFARATHDRQHVVSQALLGLAGPLQHHPLERAAHPDRRRRRLAAARGAVRLRDRPQRLPLDLPSRRPHHHRVRGRLGRRPGDAVAHRGRGQALPVPGVRPPGPRRARARPCRPRRDRRGQRAVRVPPRPGIPVGPALPGCRLPSGHQHARCGRDDRRRRAAVRGRQAARRRLRGAADARDERAALCRRGLDDRSRSRRAPRGEVRAWRRGCGHAGAGRTLLGARHARPADHR